MTKYRPWDKEELTLLKRMGKDASIPNRTKGAVRSKWKRISELEGADWDEELEKHPSKRAVESPTDEDFKRYKVLAAWHSETSHLPANHGARWTAKECRYLMDNPDNLLVDGLANKLGRSADAIEAQQAKLEREGGHPLAQEFKAWYAEQPQGDQALDMQRFAVERKKCYITLCEAMYPAKPYKYTTLEDLMTAVYFGKLDPNTIVEEATRRYHAG